MDPIAHTSSPPPSSARESTYDAPPPPPAHAYASMEKCRLGKRPAENKGKAWFSYISVSSLILAVVAVAWALALRGFVNFNSWFEVAVFIGPAWFRVIHRALLLLFQALFVESIRIGISLCVAFKASTTGIPLKAVGFSSQGVLTVTREIVSLINPVFREFTRWIKEQTKRFFRGTTPPAVFSSFLLVLFGILGSVGLIFGGEDIDGPALITRQITNHSTLDLNVFNRILNDEIASNLSEITASRWRQGLDMAIQLPYKNLYSVSTPSTGMLVTDCLWFADQLHSVTPPDDPLLSSNLIITFAQKWYKSDSLPSLRVNVTCTNTTGISNCTHGSIQPYLNRSNNNFLVQYCGRDNRLVRSNCSIQLSGRKGYVEGYGNDFGAAPQRQGAEEFNTIPTGNAANYFKYLDYIVYSYNDLVTRGNSSKSTYCNNTARNTTRSQYGVVFNAWSCPETLEYMRAHLDALFSRMTELDGFGIAEAINGLLRLYLQVYSIEVSWMSQATNKTRDYYSAIFERQYVGLPAGNRSITKGGLMVVIALVGIALCAMWTARFASNSILLASESCAKSSAVIRACSQGVAGVEGSLAHSCAVQVSNDKALGFQTIYWGAYYRHIGFGNIKGDTVDDELEYCGK